MINDKKSRTRNSIVIIFLSVLFLSLLFIPPSKSEVMPQEGVGTSADDAQERTDNNVVNLDSSYLYHSTAGSWSSWIGFRFQSVPIPQGAMIVSASINIRTSISNYDLIQTHIYGEDVDNSPVYVNVSYNISNRDRTTNYTEWNETLGAANTWYTSPDIKTAIQEIINRPGWVSGNNLSIQFLAQSADYLYITAWDANSAYGAKLNVNYITVEEAPTWSDNKTNASDSTVTNEIVYFNVTFVDANPDTYIFAINQTGTWVNYSGSYSSGVPIQNISTITATKGTFISWYFWANDTLGSSNQTDVWSFTITNAAPTTPTNITCDGNDNCNISVDASVVLNASGSTDAESDAITYIIEASLVNATTIQNTTDVSKIGEAGGEDLAYYDDFESDFGHWATHEGINCPDADAWGDRGTSTGSSGTGPQSGGVGGAGTYFIFVESSSGNCYDPGDMAIVYFNTTIDYDSNLNEKIEFYFNAYGVTIDSLYVEENSTGSWVKLWEMHDINNDYWNFTSVDLSSLTGSGTLRFNYTRTSSGYTSDIALDRINVTTSGREDDADANTTATTYNDVSSDFKLINNITVKVEVDSYNPSASAQQGTNDTDLYLEIYNGSDWIGIGEFDLNETYTGDSLNTTNANFSQTTTDSTIVAAWQTSTNQDLRIKGIYIDYYNSSVIDEINYTNVWVTINGKRWVVIGNHTETTNLTWDTSELDEQTCIDLKSKAIDLSGSNTYSSYYTKGCCLNISHVIEDTDYPIIDLQAPANDSEWTANNSLNFIYNVTDATSGITNCSLYINNTLNSTDTSVTETINQSFDSIGMSNAYYSWYVECFDDSSSYNSNNSATWYLLVNYTAPPDTCTPVSGLWEIDCADACVWDTNQDVDGNISMTGSGTLTLNALFIFTGSNPYVAIGSGCTFVNNPGGGFG